VSQTFPATIRPEDWFPCEPDEDGSYCLHEGMQYLAACRYYDSDGKERYQYVVVTASYPDGYVELVADECKVPVSQVAFLALLEGEQ
jgi:hypothetical protein